MTTQHKTEADKVAESNNWCHAFAIGYLDGKRDKNRATKPCIPLTEMTDYAHGYYRGYKEEKI